jgi:hypothetical protein
MASIGDEDEGGINLRGVELLKLSLATRSQSGAPADLAAG